VSHDGSAPLKSHRQEAFARAMAQHGDRARAVREAGYQSGRPRQQAFELMQDPRVLARIEHLSREVEARVAETAATVREEVLQSLRSIRAEALAKRPPDRVAALRANELIGKSSGIFQEVHRQADPFESMTAEQLETRIRALLSDSVVRTLVRNILSRVEASESEARTGGAEDDEEPGSVH
jgi:phage terminase small subunit